jgi:hypothetical protein
MVSIVEVVPYVQSIVPTIKVRVQERILNNTVLFKVDGIVLSQDCKFISHLKDMPSQTNTHRTEVGDIAGGAYAESATSKDLIFTLDKNALDYTEELRTSILVKV